MNQVPGVRLQVAKNCLILVRDGAVTEAFEALGILDTEIKLACGRAPWIGADRGRITNTLNALTFGVLDVVGLPRIEVPMEFNAAIIATFVHPGNMAIACRWLETGAPTADVIAGGTIEPVTANQLFALVCQLANEGQAGLRAWEQRTGNAVRDADASSVTSLQAAEN